MILMGHEFFDGLLFRHGQVSRHAVATKKRSSELPEEIRKQCKKVVPADNLRMPSHTHTHDMNFGNLLRSQSSRISFCSSRCRSSKPTRSNKHADQHSHIVPYAVASVDGQCLQPRATCIVCGASRLPFVWDVDGCGSMWHWHQFGEARTCHDVSWC